MSDSVASSVVTIKNLYHAFGEAPVLDHANLSIERGEFSANRYRVGKADESRKIRGGDHGGDVGNE